MYALAMADDEQYLVLIGFRVLRIQVFDVVLEARPLGFTEFTGCSALSGPEIVIGWIRSLLQPQARLSCGSEIPARRIIIVSKEPSLGCEVPR
jgi:hypothetical protein